MVFEFLNSPLRVCTNLISPTKVSLSLKTSDSSLRSRHLNTAEMVRKNKVSQLIEEVSCGHTIVHRKVMRPGKKGTRQAQRDGTHQMMILIGPSSHWSQIPEGSHSTPDRCYRWVVVGVFPRLIAIGLSYQG